MSLANQINFHPASTDELTCIVDLLADDQLGNTREKLNGGDLENYRHFFDLIHDDPNNTIYVAKINDEIVGTFQLTFIANLTFGGAWRAQIEGVRVAQAKRGLGIGKRMLEWVIAQAKTRDCVMVQLTTNKQRPAALDFYRNLGFEASHEGFKMMLR